MTTPRRTVTKVARQLVIDLINWEMNAADGEGFDRACAEFGHERVRDALYAVIDDLERKGTAPVEVER